MAIYVFTCEDCGPFELLRPMAEAGAPANCPSCGTTARRVFTAPGLALLAAPMRRALSEEDKSAHEPDVVAQRSGRPLPHRHEPSPPWVLSH
ncbi:MAG TPA: zinc ribbon domain-containing protein [Conexibacter sp.]|jgi:putative FmdB family regulatory protein|nr:zinc ribbon domain-containing protein [Conexibacter sp.]